MLTDVFVGMGTASINAISQNCISINIDPRNGMQKSSGIFGSDTTNFAYSESGKLYDIFTKLEDVFLCNKEKMEKKKKKGRTLFEEEFEMGACFKKLDNAIENITPVKMRKSLSIPYIYRIIVMLLFAIKKSVVKKN